MTRGVVVKVLSENSIEVKILEHTYVSTGEFIVNPDKFEVFGHQKKFDRTEVLELLRNGCKKAILDYDLSGANLSGADLSGANLSGANLSGADLSGADLRSAELSGADLSGADLSGANLSGTDLRSAELSGADLSGADLSGANLSGADLRSAELSGANLSGANLSGANLSGANLDFSCLPLKCGGLKWKIDKRLACQLAYHLCSMQCDDEEYVKMRDSILGFANQFHRVDECGKLKPINVKSEETN